MLGVMRHDRVEHEVDRWSGEMAAREMRRWYQTSRHRSSTELGTSSSQVSARLVMYQRDDNHYDDDHDDDRGRDP